MTTVKRADGSTIDSVGAIDKTPWTADDPVYTMNETAYRELPVPGGGATSRYKLWNAGDRRSLSEMMAAFAADSTYPPPHVDAPPSDPVTITATLLAHFLGVDDLTGDGLGWSVDVDVPETDPVRMVVVWVNSDSTDPIGTGGSAIGAFQFNGTPIACRLVDTASGLEDDQQFEITGGEDNGPFTLTVDVP